METLLFILFKIAPLVYVPVGVIANVISFLVTMKKHNREKSTCVFMSALSMSDSGNLIVILTYRLLVGFNLGLGMKNRPHYTL